MSLRNTILLQLSYFIEFEKYNAFVLRLYSQACVATNRLLVQDGVYDEFVSKFVKEVEKLVVGDGMDEKTDLGPLINEKAVAKVRMETIQQNKTCFFIILASYIVDVIKEIVHGLACYACFFLKG